MLRSSRRRLILLAGISTSLIDAQTSTFASNQKNSFSTAKEKLMTLEASTHGRLGVSAIDTASGKQVQYRADERFAFCSTFKTIVAAAMLKKSATEKGFLDKRIRYNKDDLEKSGYAPITQKHIADGMTIAELCAATLQYSDNAAVNLLMKELGGPAAVNTYARSIGDDSFRLDRWEPELNSAVPGDERDTTTPDAMAKSVQRLALGDALPLLQREQLVTWLKGNTTGAKRILAGVPKGWIVGDKTGTGSYGTTNDAGVTWPANGGAPIVVLIYFTQKDKDASPRDDVVAAATRIVIDAFN